MPTPGWLEWWGYFGSACSLHPSCCVEKHGLDTQAAEKLSTRCLHALEDTNAVSDLDVNHLPQTGMS
jgi:hypothetical protein